MPPCHGGDRRFESGRARQVLTKYHSCDSIFILELKQNVRNTKNNSGLQSRKPYRP